jgi:hypothetical protein
MVRIGGSSRVPKQAVVFGIARDPEQLLVRVRHGKREARSGEFGEPSRERERVGAAL